VKLIDLNVIKPPQQAKTHRTEGSRPKGGLDQVKPSPVLSRGIKSAFQTTWHISLPAPKVPMMRGNFILNLYDGSFNPGNIVSLQVKSLRRSSTKRTSYQAQGTRYPTPIFGANCDD